MLRSLTLSNVIACLIFSILVVLPCEPWAKSRGTASSFQISVESDRSGLAQLYFDLGNGFNEADSVIRPIVAGQSSSLRFPLPSGHYQALRFDPLDRDAHISLSGARIVDRSGRGQIPFSARQFTPENEIDAIEVVGATVSIVVTPFGTDPQLGIKLSQPFTIEPPSAWIMILAVFAIMVALLLTASWAQGSPRIRLDERIRSTWRFACGSPVSALALSALAGTLVANYPVIFAGRSLTSPGYGVALLYGQNPWLPSSQSSEVLDPHKADVAALLWHHLPLSIIERRALFQDAELPLWNRFDSGGLPLLGQGQSCFGDPLQTLPILANGAAWAWDLKFIIAKWLFAFGIGLCSWRAFRHLPSALLLASSAAFMGFFIYRINHPAIFSICYAPWILYCWLRCVEARSLRNALIWLCALIGANWTEMNSGTAKEAYVLLFSLNFTGLCVLFTSERPARERIRLLAGLIAAGTVFALISSPIWYTFYRALEASYTSYNTPLAFQLQPGMFIGLFDEIFYRPFQLELGVINPAANIFILIGLLWAAVYWRSFAGQRIATALVIGSLLPLALVFGLIPPAVIARTPLLGNLLHVDNTFSCVLIVIFSVLSGFGWRQAWESLGSAAGKREAAAVVVLLFLLFAVFLGTAQSVIRSTYSGLSWGRTIKVGTFVHFYGWSLVMAAAAFLCVLHLAKRRGSVTPAMFIWALLSFGAFHWRQGLRLGTGYSDYTVTPAPRVDLFAHSPTVDALLEENSIPSRVIGFHNDLLPGWSIAYGLEGISGPDALMNPYYRDFMDAAGIKRVWDWRYIVEPGDVTNLKPVFDALDVRYYVGYHLGQQRPGKELKLVQSSDMDTFQSSAVWPRAFFTDSAAVYKDTAQFISWLKAGDGRPFAAIARSDWASLHPSPRVSGDLKTRTVTAAENYHLTTNTTSFTVNATGPGFVVLTEAFEQGNFRATVNGRDVPYFRVNDAFKALYVDEAGTYEVRFGYWPKGFTITLVLFAVGLVLLASALWVALIGPKFSRRRRPGIGDV